MVFFLEHHNYCWSRSIISHSEIVSASEQFVKVKWVKYRTPTYETGVRIAGLKPIVMFLFLLYFFNFPPGFRRSCFVRFRQQKILG